MMTLRAIVCLIMLGPAIARGADPIVVAPVAPPEKYMKVQWQHGDKLDPIYAYSPEQVLRISERINYLETKAAKECVDAQIKAASGSTSKWLYIAGGVLAGAALGFCAGSANHCGLSK